MVGFPLYGKDMVTVVPGISSMWNGYGGLIPGISSIWNGCGGLVPGIFSICNGYGEFGSWNFLYMEISGTKFTISVPYRGDSRNQTHHIRSM